jgi:hypothetical protein
MVCRGCAVGEAVSSSERSWDAVGESPTMIIPQKTKQRAKKVDLKT